MRLSIRGELELAICNIFKLQDQSPENGKNLAGKRPIHANYVR